MIFRKLIDQIWIKINNKNPLKSYLTVYNQLMIIKIYKILFVIKIMISRKLNKKK